jgi:hypothetical protein
MMTFKDRPAQVVKLATTRLTRIALPMSLMRVHPPLPNLGSAANGTLNPGRPTQLPDDFIALGIINQGLDVNKHGYHQLGEMTTILPQFGAISLKHRKSVYLIPEVRRTLRYIR